MLYMMINRVPKCRSVRLDRAEQMLETADPDLHEKVRALTCSYSEEPVNTREMAAHTVRRALGADTEIEWGDSEAHKRAQGFLGSPKGR